MCLRHLLPDAAIIHKCQLMIAMILLNHVPHVINDGLEIVGGYCGEWSSLYSGFKPQKLLGHGNVVGPDLCAKGKVQRVINQERAESWIILSVEDKVKYHGRPILANKRKH